MNKKAITGAMTALITPFKDGKLDEIGYEKLIKRQIANGIDAVVPVGTTGESATLTHDEHRICIEIAVNTCKNTGVKVLAGAGSNATHEAVGLAKFAQDHGADGILSVAPYYNKPTQEGLYRHYKAIASSVEIPVLLYNVPGRVGVDIQPCTVFRLFKECENVYGVKEATGSIERCVDLLAHEPDLSVISGEDAINYPILSNGEFARAKAINDDLYAVNKIMFCESNPIPVKAAMYIAGLISSLEYRLPLCEPSAENLKKIEQTIKQYNIKGF